MTNLEVIKTLRASTFTDEDGEDYQLDLQDGLTDAEIEQLKSQFPNHNIDPSLIEILKETRGWDMVRFDYFGDYRFLKISSFPLSVGSDGSGNYWIIDISDDGELGKVYFACHDPAVFVIHSQNLNEYLNHLLAFYLNPIDCHLIEISERTIMTIWDYNEYGLPKTEFQIKNPKFNTFLSKFVGEEWTVADLRNGQNGVGFAWGRFGSDSTIEKHPTDLIWVIKNKKKGLLSRLFGK